MELLGTARLGSCIAFFKLTVIAESVGLFRAMCHTAPVSAMASVCEVLSTRVTCSHYHAQRFVCGNEREQCNTHARTHLDEQLRVACCDRVSEAAVVWREASVEWHVGMSVEAQPERSPALAPCRGVVAERVPGPPNKSLYTMTVGRVGTQQTLVQRKGYPACCANPTVQRGFRAAKRSGSKAFRSGACGTLSLPTAPLGSRATSMSPAAEGALSRCPSLTINPGGCAWYLPHERVSVSLWPSDESMCGKRTRPIEQSSVLTAGEPERLPWCCTAAED